MSDDGYTPERRRPGRPSKTEVEARSQSDDEPSKRVEETRRKRRRRADSGITAGMKTYVPENLKEPGYVYRWINEDEFAESQAAEGGRIYEKTVDDDWDIVTNRKIDGQGEGTPVKRRVDRRLPKFAYLCRKPEDWYRADKAQESNKIDAREEGMRRGATEGGLQGPRAYIPEGGIRIGRE